MNRYIIYVKKFAGYAIALLLLLSFCDSSTNSKNTSTSSNVEASPTTAAKPSTSSIPTETEAPSQAPSAPAAQSVSDSDLISKLMGLVVKGRAPKTGYARSEFGSAWADVDHNGCDTRNDILARDLTNITYEAGTGNCVVISGLFHDPYSDETFDFVKSSSGSTIEIDHIVSLSDAWQKGAQQWDAGTRKQFANDPLNLVSTSRSLNRSKSDGDAATWLPPNKEIRCAFIARQVTVKSKYQLWVTDGEKIAMTGILSNCPGQPIATSEKLSQ